MSNSKAVSVNKLIVTSEQSFAQADLVIDEQPLIITLIFDQLAHIKPFIFNITMRTPGDDKALITGLLIAQGVILTVDDIIHIVSAKEEINDNHWEVTLAKHCYDLIDMNSIGYTSYSSCGVCGSTSIKALEMKAAKVLNGDSHWFDIEQTIKLIDQLTQRQTLHKDTGGAHGAAIFDQNLSLIAIYEDIGRHNALDKALGSVCLNKISVNNCVTVISSRVSFELIQKIVMSGACILIAIGAPSSLAIKAAQRFDLTLIAFVKNSSLNVYSGEWRLKNIKRK